MTKKMKTRLELEKSRWLQTISKEWSLTACHLRKGNLCQCPKALCLACPVNILMNWLIVMKSIGDLKLGRKFNSLYDRTKIKLVPCAEKCTQKKLIKIEQ